MSSSSTFSKRDRKVDEDDAAARVISEFAKSADRLELENIQLSEECIRLRAHVRRLEDRMSILEETGRREESLRHQAEDEASQSKSSERQFRTALLEFVRDHDSRVPTSPNQPLLSRVSEILRSMEQSEQAAQHHFEEMEKKLSEIEIDRSEIRLLWKQRQEECSNLSMRNDSISRENERLVKNLAEAESRIRILERERENLRDQLDREVSRNMGAETTIRDRDAQLHECKGDLADAQIECTRLRSRIASLEADLRSVQAAHHDRLVTMTKDHTREIEELEERAGQRINEARLRFEEALSSKESDLKRAFQRIADLERSESEMSTQLGSLRTLLLQFDSERERAEDRAARLQDYLSSHRTGYH